MAFHRVERLDVLKMVGLLIPCDTGPMALVPPVEDLAGLILRGFQRQEMLPRIGELLDTVSVSLSSGTRSRYSVWPRLAVTPALAKVSRSSRRTVSVRKPSSSWMVK